MEKVMFQLCVLLLPFALMPLEVDEPVADLTEGETENRFRIVLFKIVLVLLLPND